MKKAQQATVSFLNEVPEHMAQELLAETTGPLLRRSSMKFLSTWLRNPE